VLRELVKAEQIKEVLVRRPSFTIILVSTTECAACVPVAKRLEELQAMYPMHRFYKINANDFPSFACDYGVSTAPSLLIFKDGKCLPTCLVGKQSSSHIQDWIEQAQLLA
jgi:thioredoxin-like negative regulator of GroEL